MRDAMRSASPNHSAVGTRSLALLNWLGIALFAAAAIVLSAVVLMAAARVLVLLALALVLASATCWRLAHRIALSVHESQAWSEVARLTSELERREALWSGFPGPAAAWGGDGQLLSATGAWLQLGVPVVGPPDQAEVLVGDPPRVFVVDSAVQADGNRLVLLREVTRERQALQAKDELLALVGHELRTPLTSIKGYGQLMARQLATVQDQVQRLDHLISDVLDTARAEAGRLTVRREPLSLSDVVKAAAERFQAANPERVLVVTVRAEALVEGDAERLGQVIDNLLSNAVKYSPGQTPVRVDSSLDGDSVRLSVVDQGRGIAPEHLPRLFDRFYRVSGGDGSDPAGLGLGRSIVRDLVEAHRGRVEVASRGPGTGSTFTIVLPVALALDPGPSPRPGNETR